MLKFVGIFSSIVKLVLGRASSSQGCLGYFGSDSSKSTKFNVT